MQESKFEFSYGHAYLEARQRASMHLKIPQFVELYERRLIEEVQIRAINKDLQGWGFPFKKRPFSYVKTFGNSTGYINYLYLYGLDHLDRCFKMVLISCFYTETSQEGYLKKQSMIRKDPTRFSL